MSIDLTQHIAPQVTTGTWQDAQQPVVDDLALDDRLGPSQLLLRWQNDTVGLYGPLRITVSVYAENVTLGNADAAGFSTSGTGSSLTNAPPPLTLLGNGGSAGSGNRELTINTNLSLAAPGRRFTAHLIYSYVLEIPAGQRWQYRMNTLGLARAEVDGLLGANLLARDDSRAGIRVVITPAAPDARTGPVMVGTDLPCDFATSAIADLGQFFPAGCEPCPPGVPTALPPGAVSTLTVPAASGGCTRTRFFNGMFITREDLETEQRYFRLKNRLHNRADGQGVVWGLNVARAGDQICVYPGYAADCCGNDLTLSSLYQVNAGQLLLDPAAVAVLARPGRHRMHLLLEYVECPEQPRPVHGDACSNDVTRCEMSRVRETVRLRLVPPRDFDPSNPITSFLGAAAQIAPPTSKVIVRSAAGVPFSLVYTVNYSFIATSPGVQNQSGQAWAAAVPAGGAALTDWLPSNWLSPVTTKDGTLTVTPRLELVPDSLWVLVGGTVTDQANTTVAAAKPPFADLVAWNLPIAGGVAAPPGYTFGGWVAQELFAAPDGEFSTGSSTIGVTVGSQSEVPAVPGWVSSLAEKFGATFGNPWTQVNTTWIPGTVTRTPTGVGAKPCSDEPCCPPSRSFAPLLTNQPGGVLADRELRIRGLSTAEACPPRFPVTPPWLDRDPRNPGQAGDPKALVMAALYGWLSQELVRHRAGTPNEIFTTRRQAAALIYRAAAEMLFGADTEARRAALSTSLRDLLSTWCQNLIYPGPLCAGEPHGVVIGCATVAAGVIQSVDPWGGRRWAMHYPLVAYWGQQFGLAPPDLTASRIFSLICCVSSLPVATVTDPLTKGLAVDLLLPVGHGYLAIGDEEQAIAQLQAQGFQVVRATSTTSFENLLGRLLSDLIAGALGGDKPTVLRQDRLSGGISIFSPTAGLQQGGFNQAYVDERDKATLSAAGIYTQTEVSKLAEKVETEVAQRQDGDKATLATSKQYADGVAAAAVKDVDTRIAGVADGVQKVTAAVAGKTAVVSIPVVLSQLAISTPPAPFAAFVPLDQGFGPGRIVKTQFLVTVPPGANEPGNAVVHLTINNTDVAGGDIQLNVAAFQKAANDVIGAPVTGKNTFQAGDTIRLIATGGQFRSGEGVILITIA